MNCTACALGHSRPQHFSPSPSPGLYPHRPPAQSLSLHSGKHFIILQISTSFDNYLSNCLPHWDWGRDCVSLWSILPLGIPRWCRGKEPACHARAAKDTGLIPGLGRSPGVGSSNPIQHSCLEKFHGQKSLEGYSL